jgi:hypothetical protein
MRDEVCPTSSGRDQLPAVYPGGGPVMIHQASPGAAYWLATSKVPNVLLLIWTTSFLMVIP